MGYVNYAVQGRVGVVTLNRPERLNAISGDLLTDFRSALQQAIDTPDTDAILLTGAGRAFCSGDDLKEFDQQSESEDSVRGHIEAIQVITHLMLGCDKPIIGAVHGFAVGGGFEWLLNCDMVVASENLVAFFPEMDWANFVTGGVTHILPQSIGYQRTMELLILGERQSAERLLQLGLVNWIVPEGILLEKAMAVADAVSSKSRYSVGRLKALLNQELGGQLWRAIELEQKEAIAAFLRPEAAQRVTRFGRG